MLSRTSKHTNVIYITDDTLSYLTLSTSPRGFFISAHDTVELPMGTIKSGEILRADLFTKILKKLSRHLNGTHVDILLPHEYFLCTDAVLETSSKKQSLRKRVQKYLDTSGRNLSWRSTHVCECNPYPTLHHDRVLFTGLPKHIHSMYTHCAREARLTIDSFNSDLLAFAHLLEGNRVSVVNVTRNTIRVAEFDHGMYVNHKTFEASYQGLVTDIQDMLNVSTAEGHTILQKYGVLRAHKDERVYKKLLRSLSPLIEFLTKRKIKRDASVTVIFTYKPLLGFVDLLKSRIRSDIRECDIVYTDHATFQDVLTIHRSDVYAYQPLIAQALKRHIG